MRDLEERLCSESSGLDGTLESNTAEAGRGIIQKYLIDTTAAWVFYTPLMASMEHFVAGMESKEVLKSRLVAASIHAVVMRPYGKFREWWAHYWKADSNSSHVRKALVDTSAMLMQQAPLYSLILYCSGASWKEASVALPLGLTIGAITGRPYGYFFDKWRKYWGSEPTLDK